jgi:hypothetical protein
MRLTPGAPYPAGADGSHRRFTPEDSTMGDKGPGSKSKDKKKKGAKKK